MTEHNEHHEHDEHREPGDLTSEARAALSAIEATRHETALEVASPKGYYALAGFGEGVAIVGLGIDHWSSWLVLAVGLLIVLLAMRWYTAHTGVVAWATLREPGAWRAWIMAGTAIVAVAAASIFGFQVAIVGAVMTFIVWALLGPAWDADWVRSVEEQP